jgi:hypothetical protein
MPAPNISPDQETDRYVNLLTEIKDIKRIATILSAISVLTLVGGGAILVASRSKSGEEEAPRPFEV